MSRYTTEVRYICETCAGLTESAGYTGINTVITQALPKIFDFDFPIFDEAYRSVLETKILKHYYTREIGEETVGLWKLRLDTRLNEIMPYYNKLYESELLEFNPMYDVDLTREHSVTASGTKSDTGETSGTATGTRTATGTTTGTEVTTSSNEKNLTDTQLNLHSDMPQGGINNVEDADYLTDVKKNTGNMLESNDGNSSSNTSGESESTSTNNDSYSGTNKLNSVLNNTEDYLEHVMGKQGTTSFSKLLQEYRQTFLNIDMQVIGELKDLFMNLW